MLLARPRPLGTLRVEDFALAAWNLVAVPVGMVLGGGWMSSERSPAVGLLEVVAMAGAVVAVASRDAPSSSLRAEPFRVWALAGPLIGAVALVGGNATDRLGAPVGGFLGLGIFAAVIAAFALGPRLPVLDAGVRRLLVAPFVFVTAGFFTDFVASLLDGLDLPALAFAVFGGETTPTEGRALAAFVLFALIAGSGIFYAMLVVAPRELVAAEPRPGVWLLRYLVFVMSAVIGAGGYVLL